jgi:D-arabinose 1-dehydrogenase-like Zn-dependent alcohol dehydrogenase
MAWSAGGPGSASTSAGLEGIAGIASRAGGAGGSIAATCIPGISYDGGYAETIVALADAPASIPDKLGAADAATEDVAGALNALGGARAVLATVTSAKAMTSAIDGLAVRGRLVVVGVDFEPIEISPLQLIGASRSVVGHAGGASIDAGHARRHLFMDA